MAENGTSGFTVTPYEYGDGTWADLLTKYGNTAIAYDEIGNPLNGKASYMTYTWDKGRNLVQYNFRSYSTSYTYNADGLRTSKTYNQNASVLKSTEYFIVDGRYVGEISTVGSTDYVITYVYDENGSPAGINVNGTQYWFVKNLQGDVTAILDSTGAVVAVYTYSAWGVKVSVKDADGNNITSTSHVARLNPFRYRGYMYDEETGYYYLRSRYYNPEMGRFLNADAMVNTGQDFDGNNMFAYCLNNPVVCVDYTGCYCVSILGYVIRLKGEKAPASSTPMKTSGQSSAEKPFIDNFANSDGTYSLYDNKRFDSDKIFHEQILAFDGNAGFDILNGNFGITGDITLLTGGWEGDYVDVSLLDFGRVSAGIGKVDGFLGIEAMASAWAPSLSVSIFYIDITLSANVGSIGAVAKYDNGAFKIGGAYGIGFSLEIQQSIH